MCPTDISRVTISSQLMATMRDLFPEYHVPSRQEFQELWDKGFFSFDANVLLNVYRYTPEKREALFRVLERLRDQIWVTHQAAFEYERNRLDVIDVQVAAFGAVSDLLSSLIKSLESGMS